MRLNQVHLIKQEHAVLSILEPDEAISGILEPDEAISGILELQGRGLSQVY